jgi:hypothetical protein
MIAIVCTAVAATALMGVAGMSTGSPDDFTACMRGHGVPGFPDATVTPDGRLVLEPGARVFDPFDADYQAALAACADRLPAGTDLPAEPQPPVPPQPPGAPAAPRPPAPPEGPAL